MTGAGSPVLFRASAGISTSHDDLERLLAAVELIARTPSPVTYARDPRSGDFRPSDLVRPDAALGPTAGCRRAGDESGQGSFT